MDKRSAIGLGLILMLLYVWMYVNSPTAEEMEAQQHTLDSLQNIEQLAIQSPSQDQSGIAENELPIPPSDSVVNLELNRKFGGFITSGQGEESKVSLENDFVKIEFTNKGGRIEKVLLKKHFKIKRDSLGVDNQVPLYLLEDENNHFFFELPLYDRRIVQSDQLYFDVEKSNESVTFTVNTGTGGKVSQRYTLTADGYGLDHSIKLTNLATELGREKHVSFDWVNYLDKLERNANYEKNYSTLYYKEKDEDPDNCSCTGDDEENLSNAKLDWISGSNQFFNSTIFSEQGFENALLTTDVFDKEDENLKRLGSKFQIPVNNFDNAAIDFHWYIGPNEYDRLEAQGQDFVYIIPYGQSIFGSINRHIIRPVFNWLNRFSTSLGLTILLLTLIVKFLVYPLTYKMLHSQAKMGALKPETAKLKAKFGDDMQKQQAESMKLYREYGVNPLGGCFPMVLQLPIWFALYRFFPASIDFRQHSFLWATDLSSYEEFIRLPFEIPFYGAHVSLFAIIWALSTLWYSWYNTKHMEMGMAGMQGQMMKYMQYFMPLSFIVFFNSFASGLTLYMLFSSVINIAQTLGTKELIFKDEKILAELNLTKSKPKKKGGFSARLEQAMKVQQEQAEKNKKKKGSRS